MGSGETFPNELGIQKGIQSLLPPSGAILAAKADSTSQNTSSFTDLVVVASKVSSERTLLSSGVWILRMAACSLVCAVFHCEKYLPLFRVLD